MKKKIMIWVAHPEKESFCGGLAKSYQAGAEAGGAEVRRIDLSKMNFDANAHAAFGRNREELEPDLKSWQETITWADHLVVIHPYWWAGMPARAKAVIDRALTSGFAFKYHDKGMLWDKLLKGKTGEGIITSDTPPLIDTLIYGRPGRRVLKNQILGFCGVKVKRILQFGSVKMSTPEKREQWLAKAVKMGKRAAG